MTEQVSSMRPRNEAQPEPGVLFRPTAPDPGRHNGTETQASPATKTAADRQGGGSPDVQATVQVKAVRPAQTSDATVVSPPPPGTEKKDSRPDASADPNGSGGKAAETERTTSATRTR